MFYHCFEGVGRVGLLIRIDNLLFHLFIFSSVESDYSNPVSIIF